MGDFWKAVCWLCGVVFAFALAVVVGQRMTVEAVAIVIGAIIGLAASIPVLFLVLVGASAAQRRRSDGWRTARRSDRSDIIVYRRDDMP